MDQLTSLRLQSQRITGAPLQKPHEVAAWFCGIQAQDDAHARWAIGLRLQQPQHAAVEKAIDDKQLIRTWAMRGTLHLFAAADVRWVTALTAPRVQRLLAGRLVRLELDAKTMAKAHRTIIRALGGGKLLNRTELTTVLARAGIEASGIRLSHILLHMTTELLLCYGPRRGSELTYMLLDEHVAPSATKTRDAALAELAQRFVNSRGPVTLADFCWWAGVNMTEGRAALAATKSHSEKNGAELSWFPEKMPAAKKDAANTFLLPGFDEYLIAYSDRSFCLDPAFTREVITVNGLFNPIIVIDGKVAGTWKRGTGKKGVTLETKFFAPPGKKQRDAVEQAAAQFHAFMK